MEYLQAKYMENWEKEIPTKYSTQHNLLSQYIDCNKLQDITADTNGKAAAALKKRKVGNTSISTSTKDLLEKEQEQERKEEQIINPGTSEPEVVYKVHHNVVEKRRRDKINVSITELKELVPNCKHFATNKASILYHASEHIKHLTQTNSNLLEANRRLQESNSHLTAELTELHRRLCSAHSQHTVGTLHAPPPPPPHVTHAPSMPE